MKIIQIPAALLCCMSMAVSAHAAQHVQVEDGGSYQVKISSTELSRIVVKGGRIDKVWAVNTVWDTKPDKDSGELYIRPKSDNKQPFSFFVRDSWGNTYTLIAIGIDVPSESIVLEPKTRQIQPVAQTPNANQSYVGQIKALIRDMVDGNQEAYLVEELHEKVALWKETEIQLDSRFTGVSMLGERYFITNITEMPMTLDEREFANFGEKVKAVALKVNTLGPHESTMLFVVRGL